MYDLMLTDNGDIAFEISEQLKDSLQINFVLSKSNALILDFFIDNFVESYNTDGLQINFNIFKTLNNKSCREVTGQNYYEQAIKIRLNSALGSIKGNEQIGSKLDLYKHEYVDSQYLDSNLKKIIKEAIKDILPNAEITLSKSKTQYLNYSNSYVVNIIDKDKHIEYYL